MLSGANLKNPKVQEAAISILTKVENNDQTTSSESTHSHSTTEKPQDEDYVVTESPYCELESNMNVILEIKPNSLTPKRPMM